MITFLSLLFMAATGGASAPSAIDTFCAPLEKQAGRKGNAQQIFADLASYEKDEEARWTVLRDKRELDQYAETDGAYTQAFIWRQAKGTFVSMFFTSPTGDWVMYGDYCYRADGTLARLVSRLNTFVVQAEKDKDGLVSRIRTKYFGSNGHLLQSRTRVENPRTHRPTKVSFTDFEDRVFETLSDLPFSSLLR